MTATFEPARETDAGEILRMMRRYYAHDGIPFDEGRARGALLGLLRDPGCGRGWLILEDGVTIGYIILTLGYSLEHGGRDAYLDELFVDEGRRGRGTGRLAVRHAIDACRLLGVRAVHVETERRNEAARALYRESGFVDDAREAMIRILEG